MFSPHVSSINPLRLSSETVIEALYPINLEIFEGIEIISGIFRDKVLQQ